MELLETAIAAEGSVGKLADALGVRQNVVSNWRARGLPKPWAQVLQLKYLAGDLAGKPIAVGAGTQPCGEVAHG